MMGLYVPGYSPVHRLGAAPKLLALMLAGIGAFFLESLPALAAANLLAVALYAVAGLPLAETTRQLRPVAILLAFIFLFHLLLTEWQSGLSVVLRISALVLLATLVTLTTRLSDMTDTLTAALTPLRRVGVSPARVGLVLTVAVRLVPLLLGELGRVREAQKTRGLERSVVALMVPFLIGALRLSRDMGDAIESRGFDPD
ncbi:MAG: energy-coupling factor transporter transmembrane protein EcfT [Acetobacterales bacterium]